MGQVGMKCSSEGWQKLQRDQRMFFVLSPCTDFAQLIGEKKLAKLNSALLTKANATISRQFAWTRQRQISWLNKEQDQTC